MIIRQLFAVVLAAVLLMGSGCSLFAPAQQMITVNTSPDGARVLVNGNLCHSPVSLRVPRRRDLSIVVAMNGYASQARGVPSYLSTTGILDIIGGFFFLVPFVGLASPGAWELEQTDFYFELEPKDAQ